MTPLAERRRFQRIPLERRVIVLDSGRHHLCTLVDISLRGLLLRDCQDWQPRGGEQVSLAIELDEAKTFRITLLGQIVHARDSLLGIRTLKIDLDSGATLRRLIELNLGDEALLQRELQALFADAGLPPPD